MSSFSVTSKKTYGTVQMVFTVNSIFWWNLQNRYIDRWFGKADIKKDECFEQFKEKRKFSNSERGWILCWKGGMLSLSLR